MSRIPITLRPQGAIAADASVGVRLTRTTTSGAAAAAKGKGATAATGPGEIIVRSTAIFQGQQVTIAEAAPTEFPVAWLLTLSEDITTGTTDYLLCDDPDVDPATGPPEVFELTRSGSANFEIQQGGAINTFIACVAANRSLAISGRDPGGDSAPAYGVCTLTPYLVRAGVWLPGAPVEAPLFSDEI